MGINGRNDVKSRKVIGAAIGMMIFLAAGQTGVLYGATPMLMYMVLLMSLILGLLLAR